MSADSGVYFRRDDYASFWRRLAADAVDSTVVAMLCLLTFAGLWDVAPKAVLPVCALIFFCYFVLLKRSSKGTLGYILGGLRITGIDGQRAGLVQLTIRLIFMVLGPVNYLLDLAWLSSDDHRQALRDKFADTYVVLRGAVPVGSGRLIHRYYDILGYNFLFREVEVKNSKAASAS